MQSMSRRDILKMGVVGAGALAISGVNANADTTINSKNVKFDEEYDVVIIGSGIAGLVAAHKASGRGLKVLIVEKMGRIGGNSAINGGTMAVPNNDIQRRDGIQDSLEAFVGDCMKDGLNLNHTDLLEVIYNRANDVYNFFKKDVGVDIPEKVLPIPGHSVKRAIQTVHAIGSDFTIPMFKLIETNPRVTVKKNTKFDDFILDDTHRVVGIKCRENYKFNYDLAQDDKENTSGDAKCFKAKKGVIMASGGFSSDKWFRAQQVPMLKSNIDTVTQPGSTAGALVAAMSIGVNPVLLDWIQLNPNCNPHEKGFGSATMFINDCCNGFGISINPKTGKRFVNEQLGRKVKSDAIFKIMGESPKNDNYPVHLCDRRGVELCNPRHPVKGLEIGVIKKFDTLEELAKYYNIALEPFLKTISDFNSYVKAEKDPDFGKPLTQKFVQGVDISKPPFYASESTPKILFCMGGVQINPKAQVIHARTMEPVPGLYAAGESTGGVHGASRLGTMGIASAAVFGFVAGENV